ncbi:MAG: carbohydrate kinase [Clostridia bacterium]|nr:carbohydrate kinase [Clostridia bacterium]MBQ8469369.1 carbohydrate kinase [Clostridia bacterium]MBR1704136.1 carbohydrate kinase [Clostridia bacterium]
MSKRVLDLVTVGELLVDLTETGVDERGIRTLAANPGGAPANVAVAASRLGAKTAFVGCVGKDAFGDSLRETLEKDAVDTRGLIAHDTIPTTLAVVTVNPDGERSFTFYRRPGADICLTRDAIPEELLTEAPILHFGSVSLTDDPSRSATLAAAKDAKAAGALITYDPNYRPALWPSEEEAVQWMRAPLDLVDVLKISDEETALLSGHEDPAEAAEALCKKGIRLVLITLGPDGVYYRYETPDGAPLTGTVPGFSVQVADTNGAGDTFFGAFLSKLTQRPDGLNGFTADELEAALTFANRAASLTTSRPGAIPAMPTLEEVEAAL